MSSNGKQTHNNQEKRTEFLVKKTNKMAQSSLENSQKAKRKE